MRRTFFLVALAAVAGLAGHRAWAQVTPSQTPSAAPAQPGPGQPAAATGQSVPVPLPVPPSGPVRLVPLEITINGARAGSWVLLELGGAFHAPGDAFDEWRLNRRPDTQGVWYRGQTWYPLSSVPGFEARLNAANQSLDLKFSAAAFTTTRLTQEVVQRPALTTPLTAGFVNYDLNYNHSAARDASTTKDLGALMELGVSNAAGVLTSTYVGRNLTSNDENLPPSVRRLETTFTRDFPDNNASLRLGDTATRIGTWGRSVYFGGVQLARNYALSPGFITHPVPVIAGQSSTPSTVELYINDVLRQTSQVPAGPFTIDNFPLLTGSGQAQLVVRDLLGRETVLVQNFFSHTYLLKEGLSDWGVDIGAVRDNLGIENADYGERFGSGMLRYGVSDGLTLETKIEVGQEARGAGVGASMALPGQMLGQLAVAASRDDAANTGTQWLAGAERWSLRHGFTLRAEGASREYRQVGQNSAMPPYRLQRLASYTYSAGNFGNLGLVYADVQTYESGTLTTYSANYSIRVGARSSLTFSAIRSEGSTESRAFGMNLLIPIDSRITANASTTHRAGHTDGYVSASKGLVLDSGAGWRAMAGRRTGESFGEGGVYYQGGHGLVAADASVSDLQQTLRLGAQGGLVLIDGHAFASRKVQDSFALVEVPGYPDVGVGFQSSILTRTDADGNALVPRLLPYRPNTIRLDPNELPISAEIDNIEMIVVPAARTGVKVSFPVRSGRAALITILLEDGAPAPAAAEIELVGDNKEFFVARRGEAFVTGLQAKNTLRLKWNGQSCTLNVELPEGKLDDIARVGPLVCAGVKR